MFFLVFLFDTIPKNDIFWSSCFLQKTWCENSGSRELQFLFSHLCERSHLVHFGTKKKNQTKKKPKLLKMKASSIFHIQKRESKI